MPIYPKSFLVVFDYDSLVSECAILSELTTSERKNYHTYIVTRQIHRRLSTGKPDVYFWPLQNHRVDTLFDYLHAFVSQTVPHGTERLRTANPDEKTPSFPSLQIIARKVMERVKISSETQSTIWPHWHKFFRCTYLQHPAIRRKFAAAPGNGPSEIYCAIVVDCPKDLEAHCVSSLRNAGIADWPVVSSSAIGFCKYDRPFWVRATESIGQAFPRQKRHGRGMRCSYYQLVKCCKATDCGKCTVNDQPTFDHVLCIDADAFGANNVKAEAGFNPLVDAVCESRQSARELEHAISQSKRLFCRCCKCAKDTSHWERYRFDKTEPYMLQNGCKESYLEQSMTIPRFRGFFIDTVLERSCVFTQSSRRFMKLISHALDVRELPIDDTAERSVTDVFEFINAFVYTRGDIRVLEPPDGSHDRLYLGTPPYAFDIPEMIARSEFHYMIFLNGYNAQPKRCAECIEHDDLEIWNDTAMSKREDSLGTVGICTDGAFNTVGLRAPLHVIGDFDSIAAVERNATGFPAFNHMPDQNSTDFEKALAFIRTKTHSSIRAQEADYAAMHDRYYKFLECGSPTFVPRHSSPPQSSVLVLGAGGGRKDHEMAIYKSLLDNAHLHHVLVCKMEGNLVIPIAPGRKYSFSVPLKTKCGVISLGNPTINVITSGLRWELNGVYLDFSASSGGQNSIADTAEGCDINGAFSPQVNANSQSDAGSKNIPTISTSNSTCSPDESPPTFAKLLVMSKKALYQKIFYQSTGNNKFKKNTRKKSGSVQMSPGTLEISSLHTPVLLLLEYFV